MIGTWGFAVPDRRIEVLRSESRATFTLYDHDYGLVLAEVRDQDIARCVTPRSLERLLADACREPTSLEILHYAQVSGPHAKASLQ